MHIKTCKDNAKLVAQFTAANPDQHDLVIGAFDHEKLIGVVSVEKLRNEFYIKKLFVDPSYQSKAEGDPNSPRIGQKLMKTLIAIADAENKPITLIVEIQTDAAIHIYEKLGFKRADFLDYHSGCIDMRREPFTFNPEPNAQIPASNLQ